MSHFQPFSAFLLAIEEVSSQLSALATKPAICCLDSPPLSQQHKSILKQLGLQTRSYIKRGCNVCGSCLLTFLFWGPERWARPFRGPGLGPQHPVSAHNRLQLRFQGICMHQAFQMLHRCKCKQIIYTHKIKILICFYIINLHWVRA